MPVAIIIEYSQIIIYKLPCGQVYRFDYNVCVFMYETEHIHSTCMASARGSQVVNKTRNGTEWNGMEKVNKTRNGTAESAQSTPTHPWPTELHPRKLFVHAESTR